MPIQYLFILGTVNGIVVKFVKYVYKKRRRACALTYTYILQMYQNVNNDNFLVFVETRFSFWSSSFVLLSTLVKRL